MTLEANVKKQMIKEQLKYFGFEFTGVEATDDVTISQLKLSDEAKAFVWENYNLESFMLISNHKPLVAALNTFFERGSKFEVKYNVGTGNYNHNGNEGKGLLAIERNLLWSKNEGGVGHRDDQTEGVLTLIHELTHAFQSAPPELGDASDTPELSLNDYVDAYVSREGKALYYEFMSRQILYPDNKEFFQDMQEKDDPDWSSKNIYARAEAIMKDYGTAEKSALVADFTEIMRESIGHRNPNLEISLTYDEKHKLDWLLTYTDIGVDYLKTTNMNPNLYATRFQAKAMIYTDPKYVYDLKTLVNLQAGNNYFGTGDGETIEAIGGGSARGKKNGYDVLWGGGGNDELHGSNVNDLLLGGKGDDYLHGGSGVNQLFGGAGNDTYYIGEGFDIITDSDGQGKIVLESDPNIKLAPGRLISTGKEGLLVFEDDNKFYRYLFAPSSQASPTVGALTIMDLRLGKVLALVNNFDLQKAGIGNQRSEGGGYLGIELILEPAAPGDNIYNITSSTFDVVKMNAAGQVNSGRNSDYVTGSNYNDVIFLGDDNSDIAVGGWGDDYIHGEGGRDYIVGGPKTASGRYSDNDILIGGTERDIIQGGTGNDLIFADDPDRPDTRSADELGDWALGGEGFDEIHGSGQSDFLQGGAGEDLIFGGAGHDVILGDGNIEPMSRLTTIPTIIYEDETGAAVYNGREHVLGSDGVWRPYTSLSSVMVIDPQVFNWSMGFKTGADGRVDFDFSAPYINAAAASKRLADGGGADIIDGGAGNDWIAGQTGNDRIHGGDGDDIIYGDDVIDNPLNTQDDDLLVGGAGKDKIYGGGGNDVMYSDILLNPLLGMGQIIGDGEADEMYGGAGNDVMYAGTGGDKLYGEGGNDLLIAGLSENGEFDGGENDDTLVIGTGGGNKFQGGEGLDTYVLTAASLKAGSGTDTISDSDGRWKLMLDSQLINSNISGLSAVAENKWRIGDLEIMVSGSNLIIYAVTVNAGGQATKIGKEIVFQNAVGQAGFNEMNLPEFVPSGNQAPVISGSISSQSGTAGQLFNYVVPANMFSDPDGDALTYRLTLSDGSALPSWLSFDQTTMTVSGTAPGAFDQTLRLEVSDGKGGAATTDFGLSIAPVGNQAPVISGSISSQSGTAGQLFNYVVPANMFSDPDGDALTYRLTLSDGSALPSWLSFDQNTMTVSGTAPGAFDQTLRLEVSDGKGGAARLRKFPAV